MKHAGCLSTLKLFLTTVLLMTTVMLTGCGGGGGAPPALPIVTESFRTDASKSIAIRADALNHEFLLQGNIIKLKQAPAFTSIKSRVVLFHRQGSKLFMLESQEGHTVTTDTPFAIILAEFQITAEDSGWIYFDFNQGMSKIFTVGDMYASDDDGTGYQPSFSAAPVKNSYLLEADAGRNNRLLIRQAAQIDAGNNNFPTVEVRYYLSPYLPDPDFKPTESPGFDHAGFFEVMPQLEKGGKTRVLAMKWNLNRKPIIYYISANTPAEYRDAIRNGVLYWNAALGEEIFAVADTPEGVNAPDIDRNIIQWIEDDDAGSAYADMQADPRTGEILHTQIFMTSVFAVSGRKSAWNFLKQMESTQTTPSSRQIALKNFETTPVCNMLTTDKLTRGIKALLAANATDEIILKASQAYVQEALAHEVGHTLGLRHNFAGSLAADLNGYDRKELHLNYLNGGKYRDGVIPSSSIMDYHDHPESALAVHRYADKKKALPYDESAIRFLYKDEKLDTTIPFCTDSDADSGLIDCVRFDYGNSPIEYASSALHDNFDSLPVSFYLSQVAKVMGGTSISNLRPSPATTAAQLLQPKPVLFTTFTDNGLYARTFKQKYPGTLVKDVNKKELRAEVMPEVINDLNAWLIKNPYGYTTLTDLFMVVNPAWKDAWITRFNQISEDPAFITIVDAEGKSRTFSPAERQQLRDMAAKFFTELIPALAAQDVKILAPGTAKIDIVDGQAGSQILNAMNETSRRYAMGMTGEFLTASVGGTNLNLPLFRYDWELRLGAMKLLENRAIPSALWWGVREKAENRADLTAILNSAVSGLGGAPFSDPSVSNAFNVAPNNALQWYLENRNLL